MANQSHSFQATASVNATARADKATLNFDVQRSEGVTEISLKGGLSYGDHRAFLDIMQEFNAPAGHQVVFNLSKLEAVDSSGLGMFLIANEEAKKKSLKFRILQPRSEVLKIMNLGKLYNILDVISSNRSSSLHLEG